MESQTLPPTAPQTAVHPATRRPYAPPTATFVPLKLEERLLACDKGFGCEGRGGMFAWS